MTTQGITPIPNLLLTKKVTQDPTTYTTSIDAAIAAMTREAGRFCPMSWPGAFGVSMTALLGSGHYYNGTALSEVGNRTTGNFTSGSASVTSVGNTTGVVVGMTVMAFTFTAVTFTANTTNGSPTLAAPSSTANLYVGMPVYGAGIPPGATITVIGASVTISANATANATGATILSAGFSPVVPINTVVTAVTATTMTLSQNATATVTAAFLYACQQVGGRTTGTTVNTSPNVSAIPSTRHMFVGLAITGSGIPANTTISSVVNENNIILSANATASASAVVLTSTIPAPAANSRIDWITVAQSTGRINFTLGTPAASPAPPALPAGYLPVAQLLLTSASTSIGTNELSDCRDLSGMGLSSGAYTAVLPVSGIGLGINLGVNL